MKMLEKEGMFTIVCCADKSGLGAVALGGLRSWHCKYLFFVLLSPNKMRKNESRITESSVGEHEAETEENRKAKLELLRSKENKYYPEEWLKSNLKFQLKSLRTKLRCSSTSRGRIDNKFE